MPIIVVTGKEIEKIKGDYESYLSGLNMVGEIDYSQYSQLYDEGTKHIQRAYELGKSELEKENAELKSNFRICEKNADTYYDNLTKAKEIIKKLKALYFSPVVTKEDIKRQDGILNEAERFIKDSEV